jgi:hypothetical protein
VASLRENIIATYGVPCFDDILTILEKQLPQHNMLHASPSCTPFSVAGDAKGSNDVRSKVIAFIAHVAMRYQPLVVTTEQVVGFKTWLRPGDHSKDGSSGPAFEDYAARLSRAGYTVYSNSLPAWRFLSEQSRVRLWIIAARNDVVAEIGPFSFGPLPPEVHLPVARLFTDPSAYIVVAPAAALSLLTRPSVHLDYKPHLVGFYNKQQVWADSGLSPCVLTTKRHLFLHKQMIVTPTASTLARLQGLDPSTLPANDGDARKLIGNSIQRDMHIFVLKKVSEYASRAIDAGIPAFRPPARTAWPEQLSSSATPAPFKTITVSDSADAPPLHALPGVMAGTVDPPEPPPLDLEALEPRILSEVARWSLKVKQILLKQKLAKSWIPTTFPTQQHQPSPPMTHAAMDTCAYVAALPTTLPTPESSRRKAVLALFAAASDSAAGLTDAAVNFFVLKHNRHESWQRSRCLPSRVTPSAARWHKGQAPHLHNATATTDPALRAAQTKELLSAPLTDAQTAHMEPTTPHRDRHPWAGFARALNVGSLHLHPSSLQDLLSNSPAFTTAWAVYRSGSQSSYCAVAPFYNTHAAEKLFTSSPRPDVMLIWVTRTADNLSFVLDTFGMAARVVQHSRPSVVIFGTRSSLWLFPQNDDKLLPALMHAFTGLGYVLCNYTSGKVTFSVLVALEVAERLAYPDLFSFNAEFVPSDGSSAWSSVLDSTQNFLTPKSTFRVTDIKQVWPTEHSDLFLAWVERESARATAIRAGTNVPTSDVIIFDNDLMHPEARGIVWDLRRYWAARAKGVDNPALIVPLYDTSLDNQSFNNEAICALTIDSQDSFPDHATIYDLQHGAHNNAIPPTHSFVCDNWKGSYEHYDIGSADIDTYEKRGWIEFTPPGGPPCLPFTGVAQNTVPKKGKDPKVCRRRVLDCGYSGEKGLRTLAAHYHEPGRYARLSLNERSDVTRQSPVSFSSYDRLVNKIMTLARSHLPVLLFKGDGDAWYKQFKRRLHQICDGVASWPSFIDDPATMKLFIDYTLQFGDANAAHCTYRATYMVIWILLRDLADRPATDPAVRAWQKLQLDFLKARKIEKTNLSYGDMDGFVDDFMAAVLKGEDEQLLCSFLALMRYLGLEVSLKKLAIEARPYHIKTLLGFRVDTQKMIGYLEDAWRKQFMKELIAVQASDNVSVHDLQVVGGKSIRVCCLIPSLRGFCSGTFTALRNTRGFKGSRARLHPRHLNVFRRDAGLIYDVLKDAPSVHLMLNPHELASIADGALHCDSDASSSWGLGACIILDNNIYFLHEAWTEEEKRVFDIADFEGIALEMACRYFPAAAPQAFARQRMLARVDNTNVEGGVIKMDSSKGVTMLVVKSLLRMQVQYSFKIRCVRVTSIDNVLADALSRDDLPGFLREVRKMGLTPIRIQLSEQQRSTAHFAAAKAELKP